MANAFVGAADLGNNGGSTSSLTASYTCGSGANRLLVVSFAGDSGGNNHDDVSSVTYGGVAMTLATKSVVTSQDRFVYLYYLLNPASGANNVVITCASSHFILAGAADYTGVKQSAQPDATTTNESAGAASTLTTSLTTVLDNCWAMLVEQGYNSNPPPTAGTGLTRRTADAAFGTYGLFDSNAVITPAGSYSMTTNRTSNSTRITHAVGSFAPATGAAGPATGDSATTFASMMLAGTGTLGKISGQATATLGDMTLSAVGALKIAGASAAALGDMTLSAAGSLGKISGAAATTFGDMTLSARGLDPNAPVTATGDFIIRERRRRWAR